ncbi:MAG: enolase C-terminal domain-like protein, partial [Bacteroidota bacterium]
MNITLHPLTLSLRYPFTLGNGSSRTHTPVLLIELSHEGHTAYGEAAMPPYLGEDHHTATAFINRVDFGRFSFPFDFADIHQYLDDLAPGNSAAKAGIDLALHDLDGKLQGKPLWEILGSDPVFMRPTAYTVGIDTPEIVADKVIEATPFNYIKVKLGSADDLAIITAINEVNSKPLYADVNQGWKNKEHALELVHWLKEKGVVWIEQPFAKDDLASQQWL